MSTTQAQQTYRVFAFRDGWCVLGNQGQRYWVSDGVYTIRGWAVAQAAYQRAHPKQSDRDWFEVGAWTSPSVDAAIAEAIRRLTERRAANLQRERSERR